MTPPPALPSEEKTREVRLRRAALRQDMILSRSRARDPRDTTFGTYQLTDHQGVVVHAKPDSPRGFGLALEEVEEILSRGPRDR